MANRCTLAEAAWAMKQWSLFESLVRKDFGNRNG